MKIRNQYNLLSFAAMMSGILMFSNGQANAETTDQVPLSNDMRSSSKGKSNDSKMSRGVSALAKRGGAKKKKSNSNSEVITVTGSHIANSKIKSPTPVSSLSQAEITNQAPSNNIADLVNQMPQFAGSTTPQNSRLSLSSGLAGVNALNLRNLGSQRSLVLLDGRRITPSSTTGVIDINTIPQQLVKRVDVVTGGASAQYGSDAVAGVTNFILDKKYTGLKMTGDSGVSDYGDGVNYHTAVTGGFGFAHGKGHVLLSGDYAHQDGIYSVNRSWNFKGNRIINNPNYAAGNGQPYYIRVSNAGTNYALPGGIIRASTGDLANSLKGIYFGSGGSVHHYDYGSLSTSSVTVGGDHALANDGKDIGLEPMSDRKNLFGRVSYDATPWMTLYAEGGYNQAEYIYNAGPQYLSSINLSSSNPYLVDALGASALQGVQSVTVGTTASDLPWRRTDNRRSVQRYTFGGEGNFVMFGKPASWSAYAQYGVMHSKNQIYNVMNTSRIAQATDAVRNSSGQIVCEDSSGGCSPIDWLGTGVISEAAKKYVLGNPWESQKYQQIVGGVNLSMAPFATWAGDANIAIGGEYRDERASGYVPTEYQSGWSVGNYLPTTGHYSVKEAYIEGAIPLAKGLSVDAAFRATDYSTSGFVTTWKVGGTYQPIPDIMFRVTESHDIRAPNISELFNAGTSQTTSVLDPATGQTERVLSRTTGNTDLQPEKAYTTTIGAVITPRYAPGLSVSVDWFHTKIKDAIEQFYPQTIIDECRSGYTQFCSSIRKDPSGTVDLLMSAQPFNFAKLETSGIDINASYQFPLRKLLKNADGYFVIRGQATTYMKYISDSGVGFTVDTSGDISSGPPRWIYRFSASYVTSRYSLTAVAHGISSGNYSNSYVTCSTGCGTYNANYPSINYNHVAGLFYFDLNGTYTLPIKGMKKMQIFLNVTNLANSDPLLLPESGLAADTTYSELLGRTYRGGVRLEF